MGGLALVMTPAAYGDNFLATRFCSRTPNYFGMVRPTRARFRFLSVSIPQTIGNPPNHCFMSEPPRLCRNNQTTSFLEAMALTSTHQCSFPRSTAVLGFRTYRFRSL
jgi:hypothetical protein